jgi:hypothetical protein
MIKEYQAFLPSYDLAPPLSSFSKLDRRHTERLRKRDNLLTGEGGEGGGGAKSYGGKIIHYSLLCSVEHFALYIRDDIHNGTVDIHYE